MSKHILRKHVHGFTTVSNNLIKALKIDLTTLGLYVHLLSLPDNWEFYKTQLCKDCHIGIKKLEKHLRTLQDMGLVNYGQKRDENGRFTQFYMDIYDTETVKAVSSEGKKENKKLSTAPEGQNCRTAKTVGRFREAIKEVHSKEEKKDKKEGGSSLPTSSFLNPQSMTFDEQEIQMAKQKGIDINQ